MGEILEAIEAADRLAQQVVDDGGEHAAVMEDLHKIRAVLDAARDGREPITLAAAEQAVRDRIKTSHWASEARLLRLAADAIHKLGVDA